MSLYPGFYEPEGISRSKLALAAAKAHVQRSATNTAWRLIQELGTVSGVSFVVMFQGTVRWSPTIDIAVRLLVCANNDESIEGGYLIRDEKPEHLSAKSTTRTIERCVEEMKLSGQPFAIISHVHGHDTVQFQTGGGETRTTSLYVIQHRLGDDVKNIRLRKPSEYVMDDR